MNKTEYIKILRDNQNIIKEIIRDYKSFNEDNPLPSNDEFLITKKTTFDNCNGQFNFYSVDI